jgi:hypothetical protein
MFRRSAAALMPKPESEPLLFRAERIRAKTGESGPVSRSPVHSGQERRRLPRDLSAFSRLYAKPTDCVADDPVCREPVSADQFPC